jgi:hypothetical protein
MWYELKRDFVEGAARVMWADAWACWQESHCQFCGESIEEKVERGELCEDVEFNPTGACKGRYPFPSEDLTETAPPTPDYARIEAAILLGKLEALNKSTLITILHAAVKADLGGDYAAFHAAIDALEGTFASDFGSDIALQAMGSGVSWFDDHEKFVIPHTGEPLRVPNIEFEYVPLEGPEVASISQ